MLTDEQAITVRLTSIRLEVLDSLRLFHTHVQYSISLMLAVFVASGFILNAENDVGAGEDGSNLAAVLLLLLLPMSFLTIKIVGRYYQLYVATLVESARLHREYDQACHTWFTGLEKYSSLLGEEDTNSIVIQRTYGKSHSLFLYSILIATIGGVGFTYGLYILLF